MTTVTKWLVVGAAIVVGIQLFKFQEGVSTDILGRVRTKDPEQIAIAAALTVGLGMVAVIAASLIKGK